MSNRKSEIALIEAKSKERRKEVKAAKEDR